MGYEEEVMCPRCGNWFTRASNQTWKKLCAPCWKEENNLNIRFSHCRPSNKEQELQAEIKHLQNRITDLQGRLDELQTEAVYLNLELEYYQRQSNWTQLIKDNMTFFLYACHPDRHTKEYAPIANQVTGLILGIRKRN